MTYEEAIKIMINWIEFVQRRYWNPRLDQIDINEALRIAKIYTQPAEVAPETWEDTNEM